jgi:hypothetical protein
MKAPSTIASIIRPSCVTEEHFTWELNYQLDVPQLSRLPDEDERQFLIRRLKPLQWISRHWSETDLGRLSDRELDIAANQICNAAANYCQDRGTEKMLRESKGTL